MINIYIVVCSLGGEYWIRGAFLDEEEAIKFRNSQRERCHVECWNGNRKIY